MNKLLRMASLFVVTLALTVQASSAYAHSSEVFDATGDVPASAPAYYDIVQAKVTEQIGTSTLYFMIVVAGRIPDMPTNALGDPRFVAWNWAIDAPGTALDATVVVRYCSHTIQGPCVGDAWHWESELITASGRHVNAFAYKVDGATVKAYVDAAQLGGPTLTEFNWWAVSRLAPGVSGALPADLAPDTGSVTFAR